MKLEELRKRVDLIDGEIVKLLGVRMELALRTGKHKDGIADPKREENVFSNVKKRSVGLVRPEFSEALFKEIISESKKNPGQAPFACGIPRRAWRIWGNGNPSPLSVRSAHQLP